MKKILLLTALVFITIAGMSQTSDKYRKYFIKNGDTLEVKAGRVLKVDDITLTDTVNYADVVLLKEMEQATKTASYTLVLTDAAKQIIMNSASATNLTIPLNSSVAFLLGTPITISCIGAGQTTIVLTGGVTGYSVASNLDITVLGDATIVKIGTDAWKIMGALE